MTDNPRWRGIHHLALVTSDMDATVRFYHGVLGARLVLTLGNESFRHYFFEFAPGQTVAFFEYKGVDIPVAAKPAGIPDERWNQFDHLSLHLPDEAALEELRARLEAHECEVTEVVDHDQMRSVYFTDPNGIALEASCWMLDVTGRRTDYGDTRLFGDPDPVPALRELAADGELATTPRTQLTHEPDQVLDPA